MGIRQLLFCKVPIEKVAANRRKETKRRMPASPGLTGSAGILPAKPLDVRYFLTAETRRRRVEPRNTQNTRKPFLDRCPSLAGAGEGGRRPGKGRWGNIGPFSWDRIARMVRILKHPGGTHPVNHVHPVKVSSPPPAESAALSCPNWKLNVECFRL